jgi:integrin alpha FG-GAP repeat containing protein 1
MYVIPYPKENAALWEAKISIFPSKNIVITGLAMIGTCAATVLIIVVLHWRERRQDYQAKLQDSNRFHFDAM